MVGLSKLFSLQDICLKKISTRMWQENDIIILKGTEYTHRKALVDAIAKKNVIRLGIPLPLQKDLLSWVTSTGIAIIHSWPIMIFILNMLYPRGPTEYCLTPKGGIDTRKTVELVVKDERFDLARRFQLACIYGFKESVYNLWKQNPEHSEVLDFDAQIISGLMHQRVIYYWTQILQLEDVETKTTNQEEKLRRLISIVQKFYNMPNYYNANILSVYERK